MNASEYSVDGTPVAIKTSPTGELWVITQQGFIYRNGELFLDISQRLVKLNPLYDERGLLGLAFHPTQAEVFYLFYTTEGSVKPSLTGSTGILATSEKWDEARYVSTNVVEEYRGQEPLRRLLAVKWPYTIHNGKDCLAYDPQTKRLLCALGDGGRAYDPFNLAQDDDFLHGKIVAIDLATTDRSTGAIARSRQLPASIKVVAKGIRNPVGLQVAGGTEDEPATYYLTVAGEKAYEWAHAFHQFPQNFGWRTYEGPLKLDRFDTPAFKHRQPFMAYSHDDPRFKSSFGVVVSAGQPLGQQFYFVDWRGGLFVTKPNQKDLEETVCIEAVQSRKLFGYTALGQQADKLWVGGRTSFFSRKGLVFQHQRV